MAADPKPAPRIVDLAAGVGKLRQEGRCRLCEWSVGLQRHHLVPRSQGGDDVDANIVPLCLWHHETVELFSEARAELRLRLNADEYRYCVWKVGEERFTRRYPTLEGLGG